MSPLPDPPQRPPGAPRATGRSRRWWPFAIGAAAVLIGVVAVAAVLIGGAAGDSRPEGHPGVWRDPLASAPTSPPAVEEEPVEEPLPVISLSATGDIVLGTAGSLPARDGAGFFDAVVDALAADLVMGNLEQPLTGDTGYRKCDEDSEACHAFRAPPHYAAHLRDAGFDLLNLANNHGDDYGPVGRANTHTALTEHGLAFTGDRGQFAVLEAGEVTVAVIGFSPYGWTNDLNDHAAAEEVVTRAAAQADLVVVQVHMGAEGADQTRVRPGPEEFFGEPRGDPMGFARAVIDAGADLVVGHGPHVLRGLEFYQGRLIAYSLGNFAGGGGTLSGAGNLGLGGVLKVSLQADGEFIEGEFIATRMDDQGLPVLDPQQRGLALLRDMTERDFPDHGAWVGPDGEIGTPSQS